MAPLATKPTHAMVLAAGFGLRMRPLTDATPKPLLEVRGRNLLDRVLDRLADFGIEQVVVNLHHLGAQIESHLKARDDLTITLSPEPDILETGGGVTKALPLLGEAPFFVINADVLWLDGATPALQRLAAAWQDETMDGLLLVQPTTTAYGYEGPGDFHLSPEGLLVRRGETEIAPFIFTGVQLLSPTCFRDKPVEAFSLNRIYDQALEVERLCGVRHDGAWFHVGTPEGLAEAESELPRVSDQTTGP